jgi:hypothetical protein
VSVDADEWVKQQLIFRFQPMVAAIGYNLIGLCWSLLVVNLLPFSLL